MNIRKFTGATAREALGKARLAFGEGTLILSNRQTADGVEVMATAEESLADGDARALAAKVHSAAARLPQAAPPAPTAPAAPAPGLAAASAPVTQAPAQRAPAAREPLLPPGAVQGIKLPRAASTAATLPAAPAPAPAAAAPHPDQHVEDDTAQLAMSTLSFQDYVRERMLRRRATETPARGFETDERVMQRERAPVATPAPATARSAASARPAPRPAPRPEGMGNVPRGIVEELQAMRDMIEDRFTTFAWLGQARQHPIQSNLMLKLMRAGYSPALARAILEHMPEAPAAEAMQWMMDAIERNLRTSPTPLHEEGGVYALVGATGVGKTTTVAKLAGQCARAHGAGSVGMITLDTQRVGGHEQLREHGRNLGIVAHLAHDRAALQDLLGLFVNKKLVLIDTTGIAPRDPGRDESLAVLDLPGIQRLLVLSAGTQGDTLDESVGAFRPAGFPGATEVVLSKIDEAVKLGPALDVAIRQQLVLRGVTNGQNVPQDWAPADAGELVRASMRTHGKSSAFDPKPAELGFFFMPPAPRAGSAGTAAHA